MIDIDELEDKFSIEGEVGFAELENDAAVEQVLVATNESVYVKLIIFQVTPLPVILIGNGVEFVSTNIEPQVSPIIGSELDCVNVYV